VVNLIELINKYLTIKNYVVTLQESLKVVDNRYGKFYPSPYVKLDK